MPARSALAWQGARLGAAGKAMQSIGEPSRRGLAPCQANPKGRLLMAAGGVGRLARCAASRVTALLASGHQQPAQTMPASLHTL